MSSLMNICLLTLLGITSAKYTHAERKHKISISDLSKIRNFVEAPNDEHQDALEPVAEEEASVESVVYISNADILSGTYRITQPGTYLLSEDLIFNFNAPTNEQKADELWSPNDYDTDTMAWFPSKAQQTDYDGLYSYAGLYSLGFFAGITVEADDVTIDLNGHFMEMAYDFYLQQRFFSLVELGNRQFISGQGSMSVFDTGATQEVYPANVVIKNGLLGLSSHHAIHGNNVQGLSVTAVTMHNFDVAGVSCNGCNNVYVGDSVIGPQNNNIPVLGRYTHARSVLPRLRDLADTYGEEKIQFAARPETTVQSLIDRLVSQMDMVYHHAMNAREYDEGDAEWQAASKLFLNPSGALDGGSAYGAVFSGQGSAATAIGHNVDNTADVTLSNVEIQGIYASPLEKFKLVDNAGNAVRFIFGDTIDCEAVFDQLTDVSQTKYIGDAYTDVMFAVDKVMTMMTSEAYVNTLTITDGLRRLVFENDATEFAQQFNVYGSTDIQLQSSKGAIGVRIDGVQNFKIEQSTIHGVENWGLRGSTLPGPYDVPQITGTELPNVQYGYTGNRAQGLMVVSAVGTVDNLEIYDVNSNSGSAHGIIVYDDCNVGVTNVRTRNIQAGSAMQPRDVEALTLPNLTPMACSVELRGGASSVVYSTVDRDDLGDVTGHFIIGYDLCKGDEEVVDEDDEDATTSTNQRIGQCQWCYNRGADAEDSQVIVARPKDDEGNVEAVRHQVEIASDCTNLEDGLQYILPDEQIGSVIPVTCDGGWTMLNAALTPNLVDYFTSYSLSHRDPTLMLPNTDDHTSWRDWFIPADENTLFRVSADCSQCVGDDFEDTMWGDNTAYYATGDYLCFYIRKTDNLCSIDDIYCNACDEVNVKMYDQAYDRDDPESDTFEMWQQCKYVRYNADVYSNPDHYYCTHREPFVWPALGSDGTGCTCYKPTTTTTSTVSLAQAVGQFESPHNAEYQALESAAEYLYVELTQLDFTQGTFRITQPGTYVITEDIVFDFNAPPQTVQDDPAWSPNDFNENGDVWWWPRKDQEEEYPGASTFQNPFTLGYFAGISVECSDVVIDLQGHSIEMSPAFYLQQRFFALIELANRPFAPGKGAANWGWVEKYASNVIIKDGSLGLSSHHCIHGNFLNNVLISNVQMSQFDVAGFGCGQCITVELRDLDVGPQHQSIPVLGRYTHARAALPRLQYLSENYGDWVVPFWDRSPTISSLVERLISQMDLTYNYVIRGVEPQPDDDDYSEWLEARKLFINEAGYQDASASYGLVFAGGAAVSAIGTRIANEGDITMSNVNVHGMRSHVMEKYKVYGSGTTVTMRGFFRDTFDWEAMTDNFADRSTVKYIGNAWEDVMMAVVLNDEISADWSFLYTTQIEQFIKDWVMSGDASAETGSDLERYLDVHCGTDIQVHSVKGAIGVRVDGANNLLIDGLTISDIVSTSELGSMACGEYDAPAIAGEAVYIQPGYNGHRAHALTTVYTNGVLKDVSIDGVSSLYGNAYGIRVFDGCDIELRGEISVSNINAGTIYETDDIDMRFLMKSLTNPLPQACGVYVYSDADDLHWDAETTNVVSDTVVGYRECSELVTRDDPDDQFTAQLMGACENCVVKDVYVSSTADADDDDDEEDDAQAMPTWSPSLASVVMISAFCLVCFYAIVQRKYASAYKQMTTGEANDGESYQWFRFSRSASEKTPLLT